MYETALQQNDWQIAATTCVAVVLWSRYDSRPVGQIVTIIIRMETMVYCDLLDVWKQWCIAISWNGLSGFGFCMIGSIGLL